MPVVPEMDAIDRAVDLAAHGRLTPGMAFAALAEAATGHPLAEAIPTPSKRSVLDRRVASARRVAARRGKRIAAKALRSEVDRSPDKPMTRAAARATARAMADRATRARVGMIDAMFDDLEDHAIRMASASLDEQGHGLGVAGRDRRLDDQDKARVRRIVKTKLDRSRRAIPGLRGDLRRRLERALMSARPKAAVADVLRSPLDPRRVATQPAWDVLVRSRDLGTAIATRRAGVDRVRFTAVGGKAGDGRTTILCRSAHGRVFSTGDVARSAGRFYDPKSPAPRGVTLVPPLHFRCRSRLVPVTR